MAKSRDIVDYESMPSNDGNTYLIFYDDKGKVVTDQTKILDYLANHEDAASEFTSTDGKVYYANETGLFYGKKDDAVYDPRQLADTHYGEVTDYLRNSCNARTNNDNYSLIDSYQALPKPGDGSGLQYRFYDKDGNVVSDEQSISAYIESVKGTHDEIEFDNGKLTYWSESDGEHTLTNDNYNGYLSGLGDGSSSSSQSGSGGRQTGKTTGGSVAVPDNGTGGKGNGGKSPEEEEQKDGSEENGDEENNPTTVDSSSDSNQNDNFKSFGGPGDSDSSAYWSRQKDNVAAATRASLSPQSLASSDYRFFSIDRIASTKGINYIGDDTLLRNYLYTKFIDGDPTPSNDSIFGEFRNKEEAQIATIRSLVDTIRTNLQKTNSNAFYKGTTATTNINYLNDIDEHIKKFEDSLKELDETKIANYVHNYNDKLSNDKKEARREFCRKVANEICSARQEWKRDVKIETYDSPSCKSGEEDGGPYAEGPEFSRERYRFYCIREVTDEDGRVTHTIEKHVDALFYIFKSDADYPVLEPILLAAEGHGCTVHKLPYVPAAVEDGAVRYMDVF